MAKNVDLPADYIPYKTLIICGNKFINGRVPFEVQGGVPFLVGSSDGGPMVWLQLPSQKDLTKWQYVVRGNRSLHPAVKVSDDKTGIKVLINDVLVIHAVVNSVSEATILSLDLRPIGLNIHGNVDGLVVGSNTMRRNIFENVDAMVGIGGTDPR